MYIGFGKKPAYKEMAKKIAKLSKQAELMKPIEKPLFVQVDPKNEGDADHDYIGGDEAYQEYVSNLLDDKRFQWLIYTRNMNMIDIMTAIPTNDPSSAEMRQRAAYRMDGIQILINDMVAIKRAYLISQQPEEREGLDE